MTQEKRLTDKQIKFAELLVYNEGKMSPAEAAYEAGYKTRARKAASEMRNPKYFPLVVKYIGELRAEVREKYGITFEKHVTELAQIRNKELENKEKELRELNGKLIQTLWLEELLELETEYLKFMDEVERNQNDETRDLSSSKKKPAKLVIKK